MHLARLLFVDVAHLLEYWILLLTVGLFLWQGYNIILAILYVIVYSLQHITIKGIVQFIKNLINIKLYFRLMKEIIKRIFRFINKPINLIFRVMKESIHIKRNFWLMKEIIKRIDIDPIEGSGLIFLWFFFGGLLLNSFIIMLSEHDTASFIVFVIFLIIFLIASPLLFYPVIEAYNKVIDDVKKEEK